MPNYMSANWDPVANAIKSFGNNYANTALKKLELDRQLGKDIYDAARSEAARNYDVARTEDQKQRTDNIRRLTELFKPEVFTPLQQSSIGAGVMAGDKSLNSILRGADAALQSGMKKEQYDNGDAVTKLSVALDKPVMPYQLDSETGGVLDKMTGAVTLPEILKSVVEGNGSHGGEKGIIDPGDVAQAFQYYEEEPDPYGQIVKRLRRDLNSEKAFYDWCIGTGRKPTRASLFEYIATFGNSSNRSPIVPAEEPQAAEKKEDGGTLDWLFKLFTPSAGGAVTPTVQGANPAPALHGPVVGRTIPKFDNYEDALSALEKGLITQEEFRQIAQSFGGK